LPLLAKVLQKLTKDGFLRSEQGASGGYRLARPAHAISTLEVIRAIDGPVFLASCFHDDSHCEQLATCTVKEPLRKVHEGILALLSNISISDLATDLSHLQQRADARALWPIIGNAVPIPVPR
jgi:Rrf2 family protein